MILEGLFNLLSGIINLIPFELPSLPEKFSSTLDFILNGMSSGLGLIGLFIDLEFWLACASVMLLVYNIKHVWNGIIFMLNLIPTVQISYWK